MSQDELEFTEPRYNIEEIKDHREGKELFNDPTYHKI